MGCWVFCSSSTSINAFKLGFSSGATHVYVKAPFLESLASIAFKMVDCFNLACSQWQSGCTLAVMLVSFLASAWRGFFVGVSVVVGVIDYTYFIEWWVFVMKPSLNELTMSRVRMPPAEGASF